jgi:serine/threonine-protein kinase
VLYEMAVGKPPFTGDSPVAVASKHVRDMPVLPRAANPAVPAALEAVIMKAMAKDPDDRYRSAEELRADLLRFADGRPVEAGDPGVTSMMAAVGATQAVPTSTGRTMAVPADGRPPFASPEELERKKRTRRLIILLVVLLVALGVIAFFLLRSVLGGNVTVPDVVGATQSAATQTLKDDKLTVGSATFRTSTQARGVVLSTDPKAGASVSKNSTVDLVVSEGPNIPTVTVPPVEGKELTAAISAIQGAGLTYKITDVTSTQPVGTVISQSPAAGTKIKANVPVVLTVSGTQTSVSVPSVLGQTPASAGATLSGKGLNVGSQSNACSSQYGQGVVSSQSPAAGATVQPNASVNLVISSGSCATVPGVVGQSVSAAQSAISAAGLVANTTYDTTCANGAQPGNVDSQNPAANASVSSGTSVTISVCQSATTTTTSTTTPTSSTTSTTTSTSTT